ncbi:M20 family metallopeptidase [Oscillibacter sp. GMB15532]|uniref:M20 metallopeptidase family protein n=1 Tax=Oscillibacter sp. GMB15532 TaxID=3230022 RepID=UPI0034DE5BCC
MLPELIAIRRQIHQNPELSNHETATSRLVFEFLEKCGLSPEYIFENVGVTALIRGGQPGKTIAYRADMDALPLDEKTGLDFTSQNPGCMHACGHDIHTTVLLGAAKVLSQNKSRLKGNVRLIFQGGEENFTGAKRAITKGVLLDPPVNFILAMHTWPDLPAGTVGLKKGAMMASSSNVSFEITGSGGHAAHPHRSIDPVLVSAYTMTAIQSIIARNIAPVDSAVITFGKLTAGTASNVIPSTARAEGTVRTLSVETDRRIEEKLRLIVENQAASFGATGELTFQKVCGPVINHTPVIEVLEQSGKQSIGSENLRWLETPSMGSEDFSFYLEKVPGALIRLGTANQEEQSRLPLHNSGILFDENSIKTGVLFMAQGIVDLLLQL